MTLFEDRQNALKAEQDKIANQKNVFKAAPAFDAAAHKALIEQHTTKNHEAIDKKIADDFDNALTLTKQALTDEVNIAKLNQLLTVKDVEQKFAVCSESNVFANKLNPVLPATNQIELVDCKAVHCDSFNELVNNYNTDNQAAIALGDVAVHALADCN